MNTVISTLKQRGFVNAGPLALSTDQVHELADAARAAYASVPAGDPRRIAKQVGAEGLRVLPEHSPAIARLLDAVVSNGNVRTVLRAVLGVNYKIWQINYRRSSPGDRGLSLHQDANGEFNLTVLLSDNATGEGSTSFLPASHRGQRMKDLRIAIPAILDQPLMRLLCSPMTGRAGDIGFFFNRTCHGRFENRTTTVHDAVLMSFFPAGATYGFPPPEPCWSSTFLSSIRGTELERLIDPVIGTERSGEHYYTVVPSSIDTPKPFAIEIEEPHGGSTAQVMTLRMVSAAARPLRAVSAKARRTTPQP